MRNLAVRLLGCTDTLTEAEDSSEEVRDRFSSVCGSSFAQSVYDDEDEVERTGEDVAIPVQHGGER